MAMTEWLDRFLHEPMRDNGWSLAAVLIVAALWLTPLARMWWRDRRMFRRRIKETRMADETTRDTGIAKDDMAAAQVLEPVTERIENGKIDDEQRRRWAAEGIPDTVVRESPFQGRVAVQGAPSRKAPQGVPAPLVSPVRIDCVHCKGVGYVPGVNDLLHESVALIGNNPDEVVRLFYTTLLTEHPDLVSLFPRDITEKTMSTRDEKGLSQRDKLVTALVALADLYHPGDPERMARLDRELKRFGRAHAGFVRQDGTVWGATLDEYAAVKDALFSTLVRVAAEAWKPEFTSAWSQAYDYAAAVMLAEQFRSGFVAPRYPRS